jgi:hypothetical protein
MMVSLGSNFVNTQPFGLHALADSEFAALRRQVKPARYTLSSVSENQYW